MNEKEACEKFAPICHEFDNNHSILAIVTLTLKADQNEFKRFLAEQDIALLSTIEVTDQFFISITKSQFLSVSHYPDVRLIQADKFNPR
ncbi:hypothetical protein [uncultured Paraglaciecola sp.]|uniref:hypothetical protein n=1 Tax=uncultured Paraglaciecola sp. TaxID=1765024 RepID=UPI00261A5D6B|nr:hypothetical protein [uncultured Paraglaciecola sp.]